MGRSAQVNHAGRAATAASCVPIQAHHGDQRQQVLQKQQQQQLVAQKQQQASQPLQKQQQNQQRSRSGSVSRQGPQGATPSHNDQRPGSSASRHQPIRLGSVHCHEGPDDVFFTGAWLFDESRIPSWLKAQLPLTARRGSRSSPVMNAQAHGGALNHHPQVGGGRQPTPAPQQVSHQIQRSPSQQLAADRAAANNHRSSLSDVSSSSASSKKNGRQGGQVIRLGSPRAAIEHPDNGFESGSWLFDERAMPSWLKAQLPLVHRQPVPTAAVGNRQQQRPQSGSGRAQQQQQKEQQLPTVEHHHQQQRHQSSLSSPQHQQQQQRAQSAVQQRTLAPAESPMQLSYQSNGRVGQQASRSANPNHQGRATTAHPHPHPHLHPQASGSHQQDAHHPLQRDGSRPSSSSSSAQSQRGRPSSSQGQGTRSHGNESRKAEHSTTQVKHAHRPASPGRRSRSPKRGGGRKH